MLEGLIITQGTPKIITASSSLISATGITGSQFLDLYQAANSHFDTTLTVMSLLVAILTLAVTIAIAFFAVKQINVDREISNYRDEIKKAKELANEAVEKMINDVEVASQLIIQAKETKMKFEEELKKPLSAEKQKEIKKLEKKIEALEESITYQRGVITASRASVVGNNDGTFNHWVVPVPNNFLNTVNCKKCGYPYSPQPYWAGIDEPTGVYIQPLGGSKCPNCGNVN